MFKKFSSTQLVLMGFLSPFVLALVLWGSSLIVKAATSPATTGEHIRGNAKAPVTLVEYSDFECPYCARHYPILKQILEEYGDKVKLIYKHFPLSFHPNAQKAAEASECAAEKGKFWEMHDKIFDNQQALSLQSLKQWADEIGLNSSDFNTCLDSGKYFDKVQKDAAEGAKLGVQGTPATFVNGQMVEGSVPIETLKATIDGFLK